MQKIGREARSKRAKERGPGRNKDQLALMRCIEKLRSSLHRPSGVYDEASAAANWCFQNLNRREDLEAAHRDLPEMVRRPKWPDLLRMSMETYHEDLDGKRKPKEQKRDVSCVWGGRGLGGMGGQRAEPYYSARKMVVCELA